MPIITLLIVIALAILVVNYLSYRSNCNTKKEMQCFAFESDEILKEIRLTLTNEKVPFSEMLWTPGAQSYNQPGTTQHSPTELWIPKKDIDRAKKIIESKFKLEITNTAIIVLKS